MAELSEERLLHSRSDYFEGSAYQQRFTNPIIVDGYLYYTEPVSFTGPNSGPTDCVDLRTGQFIWSKSNIPPLSVGYIYNLWDPDQHGVSPPILVAAIGGGLTGLPSMWELFDAYTGTALFNVTNVPTGTAAMGPNGEQLRYVFGMQARIESTLVSGSMEHVQTMAIRH